MGDVKAMKQEQKPSAAAEQRSNAPEQKPPAAKKKVVETGGPAGPEPTRYGDWERGGRCVDF
jgi:hypothetical protein